MTESNVVNFKTQTTVDREDLAALFEKYKELVEKGEVVGVAMVCITPEPEEAIPHIPLMEFVCLAGASAFQLVGGMHILSTELCIDRMIEMKFGEFLDKITP